MKRAISLFVRKIQSYKSERILLKKFVQWKFVQNKLVPAKKNSNRVLIIRLDDIGDYILFRNTLGIYKNAEKWSNYKITLLGNIAWKEIFDACDKQNVDSVIWVDKALYLNDEAYRLDIWKQLATEGFSVVICPSRTRPLLLEDLCATATGATEMIAAYNNCRHISWNKLSDTYYSNLFKDETDGYEFDFNMRFANWCCNTHINYERPYLETDAPPLINEEYILCFIGSSTRSKNWPVHRWISFVELCSEKLHKKVIIAGGRGEQHLADEIQKNCNAESIVGKVSLKEMIDWVSHSSAIVSNDSMAIHLAISCNIPVVIVANGINAVRFTKYKPERFPNVATMYPDVFTKKFRKEGAHKMKQYTAVTADIASIESSQVFSELVRLLKKE